MDVLNIGICHSAAHKLALGDVIHAQRAKPSFLKRGVGELPPLLGHLQVVG